MRTLIINLKNYQEILGDQAFELARAAQKVAEVRPVEMVVAPPHPLLGLMAARTRLPVFGQSVTSSAVGATTGAVVPEALKAAGCAGTLLNHSESPLSRRQVEELMPRLRALGLKACLCAKTAEEAADLSTLGPDYVAVEPPELIGSGVAVSRARPELLSSTVAMVRKAGFAGKLLCGAGIVTGDDVKKAIELGTEGILVSSSVVKARDWQKAIGELAGAMA
jgi:triosephosphate isomerase